MSAAPASITGRSSSFSNTFGSASATSMEPAPNSASAAAVAVWVSPKPDCTSTTVFTITMELPEAIARFRASSPCNLGVAR